jgi:hypothetical protein
MANITFGELSAFSCPFSENAPLLSLSLSLSLCLFSFALSLYYFKHFFTFFSLSKAAATGALKPLTLS